MMVGLDIMIRVFEHAHNGLRIIGWFSQHFDDGMFLVTRMFGLNDRKCGFILGARLYLDVVEHGNEFNVELVIKGCWNRSSRVFRGVGGDNVLESTLLVVHAHEAT
jgi:hypothetical protein